MLDSQRLINSLASSLKNKPLSAPDAVALQGALRRDADALLYSSVVSYLDAVRGLDRSFQTWATVKLYYTVFYALRAYMAAGGICLFYEGSSPFEIVAKPGEYSHRQQGTTHRCVLNLFTKRFGATLLLSQTIASDTALEWMVRRREEANYLRTPFPEPYVTAPFVAIDRAGLVQHLNWITEQITRKGDVTPAFDPDHAILAYPLLVLWETASVLSRSARPNLPKDASDFILNNCRVGGKPTACLRKLVSTVLQLQA